MELHRKLKLAHKSAKKLEKSIGRSLKLSIYNLRHKNLS